MGGVARSALCAGCAAIVTISPRCTCEIYCLSNQRDSFQTHITAKTKTDQMVGLCFWWESACTNRAENRQEFSDLMQQVKEFEEKWLISPMGEN